MLTDAEKRDWRALVPGGVLVRDVRKDLDAAELMVASGAACARLSGVPVGSLVAVLDARARKGVRGALVTKKHFAAHGQGVKFDPDCRDNALLVVMAGTGEQYTLEVPTDVE